MPILLWGFGSLAVGAAIKMAGDGVEDAAKGTRDLAIAAAVVGGGYLYAKNQGWV